MLKRYRSNLDMKSDQGGLNNTSHPDGFMNESSDFLIKNFSVVQ